LKTWAVTSTEIILRYFRSPAPPPHPYISQNTSLFCDSTLESTVKSCPTYCDTKKLCIPPTHAICILYDWHNRQSLTFTRFAGTNSPGVQLHCFGSYWSSGYLYCGMSPLSNEYINCKMFRRKGPWRSLQPYPSLVWLDYEKTLKTYRPIPRPKCNPGHPE